MSVCEQSITLEKWKVKNISDLIAIIQFQFSLIFSSGKKEAIEKILTTGIVCSGIKLLKMDSHSVGLTQYTLDR